MTGFKIYKEGCRVRKHIYEISEADISIEIGDWLNNNFEVDNEDFEAWEKNAEIKEKEILKEVMGEDGFDMGDYIIYLREDGSDYKDGTIVLSTYNYKPYYLAEVDDEYICDKYGCQHFTTIEEAKKVIDENSELDSIKTIIKRYNMNVKQISDRFGIPYRTVQNWSAGYRECPAYIISMMDEILSKES